jgi:hypothetical protein
MPQSSSLLSGRGGDISPISAGEVLHTLRVQVEAVALPSTLLGLLGCPQRISSAAVSFQSGLRQLL